MRSQSRSLQYTAPLSGQSKNIRLQVVPYSDYLGLMSKVVGGNTCAYYMPVRPIRYLVTSTHTRINSTAADAVFTVIKQIAVDKNQPDALRSVTFAVC